MELPVETKLIQDSQHGNVHAFGQLYDTYIEAIYSFIFFRVQHKETAEDLTGDVFFKALRNINRFNPTKASFKTWLYQIARNRITDYFRTNKTNEDLETAADIASPEAVLDQVHQELQAADIERLLKTLPTEAREIITMRLWDDLSYKEIAEVLGKSEASLKMQFTRSIDQLKEYSPLFMGVLFTLLI